MIREDFILTENGDFPLEDTIVNNQYLPTPYGASDPQHIKDAIVYEWGAMKHAPQFGFGVFKYLNSEFGLYNAEKNLRIELKKDGYDCKNGVVSPQNGGGFIIDSRFVYKK